MIMTSSSGCVFISVTHRQADDLRCDQSGLTARTARYHLPLPLLLFHSSFSIRRDHPKLRAVAAALTPAPCVDQIRCMFWRRAVPCPPQAAWPRPPHQRRSAAPLVSSAQAWLRCSWTRCRQSHHTMTSSGCIMPSTESPSTKMLPVTQHSRWVKTKLNKQGLEPGTGAM